MANRPLSQHRPARASSASEPPQAARMFLVQVLLAGAVVSGAAIVFDTLALGAGYHWTLATIDVACVVVLSWALWLLARSKAGKEPLTKGVRDRYAARKEARAAKREEKASDGAAAAAA